MNTNYLTLLLAELLDGTRTLDDVAAEIAAKSMTTPLADAGGTVDVRVDTDRARRCGFPEVIFARGKTPEQVGRIAAELLAQHDTVLATRSTPEHVAAVRTALAVGGEQVAIDYHELSGVLLVQRGDGPTTPPLGSELPAATSAREGLIVVASAGTSDMPIAEEAALCAEAFGARVERLYDVGVAGVHRALEHTDLLREARVVIAVAGMEGALPSLVAGMVNVPVIAVPTSVGYGAHLGGLTPLLAMLTSCAGGIGVVNIDNGFGAAVLASRINSPTWTAETSTLSEEIVIAHLDCSTGVSGDKFLGALLDIGEQTGLFTETHLAQLMTALAPESKVAVSRTLSHGISATTVSVESSLPEPHSRTFATIKSMIAQADLVEEVAEHALAVFTELATVEASIHGVDLDEVSFHEVGSLDSILDVVGVCYGLFALGIEELYATPPALGSGAVMTQHGELPVPAPATAALLRGIPTALSDATGELTTPTGAALLGFVDDFCPLPPMFATHVGYGAGTRDIGRPNICQLTLGIANSSNPRLPSEPTGSNSQPLTSRTRKDRLPQMTFEEVAFLETNIDHISPEAVGFALEELFKEGALDVWVTPIVMKKGRAATTLSVLVPSEDTQRFAESVAEKTGSLGVRVSLQPRFVADREEYMLETPWGTLTIKSGSGKARAEHEDLARIARENSLGYLDVLRVVDELILSKNL